MYTVTVSAPGFDTYRATAITVSVGSLSDPAARLSVGAETTTVEVTSGSPVINTISPDFSNTIDPKILEDLPVNNYRWSAYALLTPGVVADSSGSLSSGTTFCKISAAGEADPATENAWNGSR